MATEQVLVEQTHGEKKVRLQFNPSNDTQVQRIKKKAADLIDEMWSMGVKEGLSADETAGLTETLQRAIDKVQEASMLGVFVATHG